MYKFLKTMAYSVYPALFFITNAQAALIGESAFSGNEWHVDFGTIPDATQQTSVSYSYQNPLGYGYFQDPMVVSVTGNPSNNYFDITDCCGALLFSNYGSASHGNALRFYDENAVITVDLPYILNVNPNILGVNRVGGWLSSSNSTTLQWLVSAYDSLSNVIESATFTQPALDEAVFFGFESSTDIARITIDEVGGASLFYTFLDDIRYESISPIPIPPTIWLFGSGILAMIGMARYKKAG